MTTQRLRVVDPGERPAPRVDDDSALIVAEAIDALAALRTPYWLGDTAVHLHAPRQPHPTRTTTAPAGRR